MVNTSKKDDITTNRFRLFSSESSVDTRQNIITALNGSIFRLLKEYSGSMEKGTAIRMEAIFPQNNKETGSFNIRRFRLYLMVASHRKKLEKSRMFRMPSPFVMNMKII
jgi:hypothetical protein